MSLSKPNNRWRKKVISNDRFSSSDFQAFIPKDTKINYNDFVVSCEDSSEEMKSWLHNFMEEENGMMERWYADEKMGLLD